MEETKQQPLGLRVCAELAGSFLLCFAIYAFSTWGSAVYGVNVVFMAVATGLAYAVVTAIFSRISGGQFNPAVTVAAVNEGLTQNPLQQLWVFWIAPVLAAAVVALVMIIVQMATTAKPKAEPTDEGDMADLEAADEQAAEDSAEDGVAEQAVEAEVRDQQADAESNADEGIERD